MIHLYKTSSQLLTETYQLREWAKIALHFPIKSFALDVIQKIYCKLVLMMVESGEGWKMGQEIILLDTEFELCIQELYHYI